MWIMCVMCLMSVMFSSGVKFVIKQESGVRKQFLIVNNEALMAFVKKKKKFTKCESFTDISSTVKCKVRMILKFNNIICSIVRLFPGWHQSISQ